MGDPATRPTPSLPMTTGAYRDTTPSLDGESGPPMAVPRGNVFCMAHTDKKFGRNI